MAARGTVALQLHAGASAVSTFADALSVYSYAVARGDYMDGARAVGDWARDTAWRRIVGRYSPPNPVQEAIEGGAEMTGWTAQTFAEWKSCEDD